MSIPAPPSPSIPTMLWVVLAQLERAHADEGAGRDSMPTLDLWSNTLRVLDSRGVDRRELAPLTGLSKRAAKTRLATAIRGGWAEEATSGTVVAVRWTARGTEAARRWPALRRAAEARWRADLGDDVVRKWRASIEPLVAQLPLEHPHYPASYGSADASMTGGPGQDWKPVKRSGDGGVPELSHSALVSQAAVNFAMTYEKRSDVAFSLAANVLTKVPTQGRALRGLAPKPWLSALERHRYVRATSDTGPGGPIVVLTGRGRRCAGAHDALVAQVEATWAAEYGQTLVADLRDALGGLNTR